MPIPRYFQDDEIVGKSKIMVGIEGYSVDGDVKTFIFFRNIRLPGDLNTLRGRERAADILTKLKLELGADGAVGPGIKLNRSDCFTSKIEMFMESDIIGIYVEKEKRFILSRIRMVDQESDEYKSYREKAIWAIPRAP